jgi:hypothetical protein
MRTIHIRSLAVAGLVFAAVAASAAQKPESGVLTAPQVRELVSKAQTPAEHSQLRDHFAALAERYQSDADRFSVKASLPGPPRASTGFRAHWIKLGETAAAMAKTSRELAAFHGQLATGAPATRPADSAHVGHLERGAGAADVLSTAQLQKLIADARTPADHGKIAEYFNSVAAKYTADADSHVAMASAYRGTKSAQAAAHCDRLAEQARTAAVEAKALAAEHASAAK